MDTRQAELVADHLNELKKLCAKDPRYSMTAYCIEMALLDISSVLAKQNDVVSRKPRVLTLVQ